MKEVLFNFIIVLFSFSLCLAQDNLDEVGFIGIDFLPYQENNTVIGLGFSNDKNSEILFSFQNWFTDNLYLSGALFPNKNVNNLFLQHSLNLGYMQKINNQVLKSLVYNLGYHKKKYEENNFKNVSYGILTYFKIKSNFISIYYNFLDSEVDNFEQLGFEYYRKLNQNYFIKIGSNFIKNDKDYINTIYLKLNYCL